MRLLIADDEPKLCQLIINLIDFEKLDLELVGQANNGLDALDIIKYQNIDIVLTDVRMPGLNGIELMEEALKIKKDIYFIVISGYDDFSYVQSALRMGAIDYILKPIKKSELNQSLENAILKPITIKNKENKISVRKNTLKQIFIKKYSLKTVTEYNEKYFFDFKEANFMSFCLKISSPNPNQALELSQISFDIESIFNPIFKELVFDYEYTVHNCFLFGILNFSTENYEKIIESLKLFRKKMVEQKSTYDFSIHPSIGVSFFTKDVTILNALVTASVMNVDTRLFRASSGFFDDTDIHSTYDFEKIFPKWEKDISLVIESLNTEFLTEVFSSFQSKVDLYVVLGWELLETVKKCKEILITKLLELDLSDEDILIESEVFNSAVNTIASAEMLINYFFTWCKNIISHISNTIQSAPSNSVRLALKYIEENYAENLSLEHVGEYVGLNASYFSTLFKKETNKNFLEYLTEVRIAKAKYLLANTNDTILSIASQVGYQDVKHFSKLFKKYAMLKPTEYRKFYS